MYYLDKINNKMSNKQALLVSFFQQGNCMYENEHVVTQKLKKHAFLFLKVFKTKM